MSGFLKVKEVGEDKNIDGNPQPEYQNCQTARHPDAGGAIHKRPPALAGQSGMPPGQKATTGGPLSRCIAGAPIIGAGGFADPDDDDFLRGE